MSITDNIQKCQWCGMWHDTKCPLITKIEYFQDGTIKSIEFVAGLIEGETIIPISK